VSRSDEATGYMPPSPRAENIGSDDDGNSLRINTGRFPLGAGRKCLFLAPGSNLTHKAVGVKF
jgi:hypothetical protein